MTRRVLLFLLTLGVFNVAGALEKDKSLKAKTIEVGVAPAAAK